MPRNKLYSYIQTKNIEYFSQTNTPTNTPTNTLISLPLFDESKIYKVGDQFQDSNGVAYNTVNSNQKFYILVKQYPTIINGLNVIVTAYIDPEWLSPETCWNSVTSSTPTKNNISCVSSMFLKYRTNQGSWTNAISQLNPNIETSLYKNGYEPTEMKDLPNTNHKDIFNNTGITLVPHYPIIVNSNMFTTTYDNLNFDVGVYIVFKQGFTPPNRIYIDEVFGTLIQDTSSPYFSYFFQKLSNNPPDNFTPLISSSNINSFWNKYLSLAKSSPYLSSVYLEDIPNTQSNTPSNTKPNAPPDCCTIA